MTKLNVELTDRQVESLESMALAMDTSKGGVIKKAMSLLKVVIKEKKEGNHIAVVNEDSKIIKEIVGIFND